MKRYQIIYADPPWRYEQKSMQGAAEKHYPTMSIADLCVLPVANIAAEDSTLFLWATLWGDRIFEKCGIGRDEGGDGGKTLEIRGKRRLSARDGGANYQQS